MMKARRSKNAPYCIIEMAGRGGPDVPFILSKIVVPVDTENTNLAY